MAVHGQADFMVVVQSKAGSMPPIQCVVLPRGPARCPRGTGRMLQRCAAGLFCRTATFVELHDCGTPEGPQSHAAIKTRSSMAVCHRVCRRGMHMDRIESMEAIQCNADINLVKHLIWTDLQYA